MLLRFRVGNHRSLWQPQELSLVASSLDDEAGGLIACPHPGVGRVLPTAVIYGANASGKTNIIKALSWMYNEVLHSHSRREPGQPIDRQPFALDPEAQTMPTVCDVDFIVDDIRYHYGFEATDTAYTREWLYAMPKNRQRMLFERNGKDFQFGRDLKGRARIISELTRDNSLFLGSTRQNGLEIIPRINEIYLGFLWNTSIFETSGAVAYRFQEREIDARSMRLLRELGTGIHSFRRGMKELDDLHKRVRRLFLDAELKRSGSMSCVDEVFDGYDPVVELGHMDKNSSGVFLSLDQESDGTLRLLVLLDDVFKALDHGFPLLVDELNASLHTQACEAILALFSNPETNPKGAQLIATTHDTNLLRSPLLRRDQIWFTEKDHGGATHLYPLTDFRTRKGDNLEKGYLQGRFGAIPFAGSAAGLIGGR